MELREFFREEVHSSARLDAFIQIMELYVLDGKGVGCVCPESYAAELPEDAGETSLTRVKYGEVSFAREARSESIFPVPRSENGEKGDVFCLGVMMHDLCRGKVTDLQNALLCVNMAEPGEPFPFLAPAAPETASAEEKKLCELIALMTDLNVKTRPTMSECLDIAVKGRTVSASVRLIDKNTMRELKTISAALDRPLTEWLPEERYDIGGRGYLPLLPGVPAQIRFRLCGGMTCDVVLVRERYDHPERMPVPRLADDLCVGIDLGTWSSSVSFVGENGLTEDADFTGSGEGFIPTAMLYLEKDKCLFGVEAKAASAKYPAAYADCFKRRIETNEFFRCTAVNGDEAGDHYDKMAERFLRYLKGLCEERFGERFGNAQVTLTVPACYDAGMKTTLLNAAQRAGLSPAVITEPEAAAVYFGMRSDCKGNLIVLDIGGGTTDVCLLECSSDGSGMPQVSSRYITGAGQLGGIDLTAVIADKMLGETLRRKYDLDMSSQAASKLPTEYYTENRRRLLDAAESIKLALSENDRETASVELWFADTGGYRSVEFVCKRRQYEVLTAPMIKELSSQVRKCIAANGLNLDMISDLILTGGASATPAIRAMAEDMFAGRDCRVHYVSHRTAVSRGAAVYSNEISSDSGSAKCLSETNCDIGTVFAPPFSGREIFSCLIPAGKPFNGAPLTADFECSLTSEEQREGYCKVVLFRRPRDFSHVESPFDADGGDMIKMTGTLCVPQLPPEFDRESGRARFRVTLDPQECITCDVDFYNMIPGRGGRKEKTLVSQARAVFIPLGGTRESAAL